NNYSDPEVLRLIQRSVLLVACALALYPILHFGQGYCKFLATCFSIQYPFAFPALARVISKSEKIFV
ncbi:MAG: hypothetical protein ACOCTM_04760, partial [Bacteroidota bacterium]